MCGTDLGSPFSLFRSSRLLPWFAFATALWISSFDSFTQLLQYLRAFVGGVSRPSIRHRCVAFSPLQYSSMYRVPCV